MSCTQADPEHASKTHMAVTSIHRMATVSRQMMSQLGWMTVLLGLLVMPTACRTKVSLPLPPDAVFNGSKLEAMDDAVTRNIEQGNLPGGVLWLEQNGRAYHRAFGSKALVPEPEVMTTNTVFDVASLTKVLATTPAIMKLVERGRLTLDDPVASHFPEFAVQGKESITVRHLLTHTSGLRPGLSAASNWYGREAAMQLAWDQTPTQPPGTRFVYSDINFILLGELVRKVDGRPLDVFARDEIFEPLGMKDTRFHPVEAGPDGPFQAGPVLRCAPTEQLTNSVVLRGVVHDPTARRMGGVAGHAGLFSTTSDIARFARMLLNDGRIPPLGRRMSLFSPESIRTMTQVQTPPDLPKRGLGWDIDSPYAGPRGSRFPIGSYGHTGWTGTSIWIDPDSSTFVIFLSNRNHPSEKGDVRELRRTLGTLAAEAVLPPDLAAINSGPTPYTSSWSGQGAADRPDRNPVLQGIDVMVRDQFAALRGKRVGLITNHTGQDRERRSTIDLLHESPDVTLVSLFSPEHGIRGELDEQIADGRDERTGLPVYSLYGDRRAPASSQLEGLDALIFDIQDIGCRFYTYISTLGLCMEAATQAKLPFWVLDRINPIGGTLIEGPVLTRPRSFVAWHEIPVRHGMTVGELARLFRTERNWDLNLQVVALEGWDRSDHMEATGLPWTNPSPNMRSLTQAILYPGVGLLEFCELSVGRGTDTPFERIGAPYIHDVELAHELRLQGLPGVGFTPIQFTPIASKFMGQKCGGVQILITDRSAFRPVDLGITLAVVLQRLHGDALGLEKMDRLLGDGSTLEAIRSGQPLETIRKLWLPGQDQFVQRRLPHLLY